jgi:hypothetical protein
MEPLYTHPGGGHEPSPATDERMSKDTEQIMAMRDQYRRPHRRAEDDGTAQRVVRTPSRRGRRNAIAASQQG